MPQKGHESILRRSFSVYKEVIMNRKKTMKREYQAYLYILPWILGFAILQLILLFHLLFILLQIILLVQRQPSRVLQTTKSYLPRIRNSGIL